MLEVFEVEEKGQGMLQSRHDVASLSASTRPVALCADPVKRDLD